MTEDNQRAAVASEADYDRDFVLTPVALEEDLSSCRAFIDRVRGVIASTR